jgi:hypothetical protein
VAAAGGEKGIIRYFSVANLLYCDAASAHALRPRASFKSDGSRWLAGRFGCQPTGCRRRLRWSGCCSPGSRACCVGYLRGGVDYRGEIVRIFAKNLERPHKPRPRRLTLLSEALMIRPYANCCSHPRFVSPFYHDPYSFVHLYGTMIIIALVETLD